MLFSPNAHASGSLREPYGYRGAKRQPSVRCAHPRGYRGAGGEQGKRVRVIYSGKEIGSKGSTEGDGNMTEFNAGQSRTTAASWRGRR